MSKATPLQSAAGSEIHQIEHSIVPTTYLLKSGLGEDFKVQDLIKSGKAGDVNAGDAKVNLRSIHNPTVMAL